MTFTYDPIDITTDLAKIRTLTGDTDSDRPLLTDEQHQFYLNETDNIYLAAANSIKLGILPFIARKVDRNGTGYGATRSQMTTHYKDLAKDMEAKASGLTAPVEAGTSVARKASLESDSDFTPPTFQSLQHKNTRQT